MALAEDRDTREHEKFNEDGGVKTSAVREVISVTPVINTVQYSSGYAVGGKQTLAAGLATALPVELDSLVIIDKGDEKAVLDLLFFDADPSAATITNNSAFAFSTDIAKLIGRVHIAAEDYVTYDSIATVALKNIGLLLKPTATSLYVAVVTTGTPTYAVGDLIFKYGFKQS